MTPKQNAVMWMGLTLILIRLFTTHQWSDIWTHTILNKKAPRKYGHGSREDKDWRNIQPSPSPAPSPTPSYQA